MKKRIILIAFLFVSVLIMAQQNTTTIKVSARAIYVDDSPVFKATISLSNAYSSLPPEVTTLDILKQQYKEALKAKGIAWSELKENTTSFGYENLGYGKEGILYEFRTKSLEKMVSFLKVKSLGVNINNPVSIITINKSEAKELCQKALNNAKEKAEIIAASMGRQLGDIQEIEDSNNPLNEDIETYLYYDKPVAQYIYSLNVVFTVK